MSSARCCPLSSFCNYQGMTLLTIIEHTNPFCNPINIHVHMQIDQTIFHSICQIIYMPTYKGTIAIHFSFHFAAKIHTELRENDQLGLTFAVCRLGEQAGRAARSGRAADREGLTHALQIWMGRPGGARRTGAPNPSRSSAGGLEERRRPVAADDRQRRERTRSDRKREVGTERGRFPLYLVVS